MAGWDDDEDDDPDDPFSLTPPDEGWEPFELPHTWDSWWEFDWDSYEGDYEEYAVSADYE